MQFVAHGPDIPERLLQSHEEGKVVFFCGAGISYPANLPTFKKLTTRLYADLAVTPNDVQKEAIAGSRFDTAISLLEQALHDGRKQVRRALFSILQPKLDLPGAIDTHRALLALGKTRQDSFRLITTNFDRLFDIVMAQDHLDNKSEIAPFLSVPKARWNGLVYLHGRLPEERDLVDQSHLVLSSGDFGLAYLTERWASRFVTELFRNYSICFVGYSIDDPVMRYMMDALAADRSLGESTQEMFAFGSYSAGTMDQARNVWMAKNVTPILYPDDDNHVALHRTLSQWATSYRDGITGKERIVAESVLFRPSDSTPQDDYVGRLLWAISDRRGIPARLFANLTPTPSLDWLDTLCERRFGHDDLPRFGITPREARDNDPGFSLIERPYPYDQAAFMALVSTSSRPGNLDEVMQQLMFWFLKHLDNPRLLLWFADRGGHLHPDFSRLVRNHLNTIATIEKDKSTDELEKLKVRFPDSIPRPCLRLLWRMLIAGMVRRARDDFALHSWAKQFTSEGVTTTLRMDLKRLLSPCLTVRKQYGGHGHEGTVVGEKVSDFFNWDIHLATAHASHEFRDLAGNPLWTASLPLLLDDFTALLRDAVDIMHALSPGTDVSDMTFIGRPSITAHDQNSDFQDWTVLVDMVRDAWIACTHSDAQRARLVAEHWWGTPYPLFKRLALFAATYGSVIPEERAVEWLVSRDSWWLWSPEAKRESMRLIVSLAPRITGATLDTVVAAILRGPPRALWSDPDDEAGWLRYRDSQIFSRLKRLRDPSHDLGEAATRLLSDIQSRHPTWRPSSDEREEFSTWSGRGEGLVVPLITPVGRRELAGWLRDHQVADAWHGDNWQERCRDEFLVSARALRYLSQDDCWPLERWRDALRVWSSSDLAQRSWRVVAPILARASDEVIRSLSAAIGWWLQNVSRSIVRHQSMFLDLCRRVIALDATVDPDSDDRVAAAINHPLGHVVEGLFAWWLCTKPNDGAGLPADLEPIFTQILHGDIQRCRSGVVIIAANVLLLFRVDPLWTAQHVLPLFDWSTSSDAALCAWAGFLWSPRLYRPLITAIKQPFLDMAHHYGELGKHADPYVSLLTFAALEPGDFFTRDGLSSAVRALPPAGQLEVAQTLSRALEGAGDNRSEYWANRIHPFIRDHWPLLRENFTPQLSHAIAMICVSARDAFPQALEVLSGHIKPTPHTHIAVYRLNAVHLCSQFPAETLRFLGVLIDEGTRYVADDLCSCLKEIHTADPLLKSGPIFQRLITYVRSWRGDFEM